MTKTFTTTKSKVYVSTAVGIVLVFGAMAALFGFLVLPKLKAVKKTPYGYGYNYNNYNYGYGYIPTYGYNTPTYGYGYSNTGSYGYGYGYRK